MDEIAYTDPVTGEVHAFPVRTESQMREAYEKIKAITDQAKAAMDELKPLIVTELERNGEKPITFADGARFELRRRSINQRIERSDLAQIIQDEDTLNQTLRVHVPTAKAIVKELAENRDIPDDAPSFDQIVQSDFTDPYPQLMKPIKPSKGKK